MTGAFRAPSADDKGKVLGWTKTANLGVNLSFSSSQDVVGQTDGSSQSYGANLKGGLNRVSTEDEWRNNLSVLESTTRTPTLPTFIKASDEVRLDTMYMYSLPSYPAVGPYVRGEANAPLFSGEDVRATPQTYIVNGQKQTASSLHLSDGLKPLNTKESVGAFYKVVDTDRLHVELRLGLAALQIAANGQYSVQGADKDGNLLVNNLADVNQAGVEGALGLKGKVDEKSTYELGVETLTPFINNKMSNDTRDAFALTNVEGYVKLMSKMTSWASFGYDYKVKMQPQLLDRAQQIHLLVINFNYDLI